MRAVSAVAIGWMCISAPAVAAKEAPEDKEICKRDRSFSTGSHLSKPRKICMRASEWKELEAESQRNVDKLRDRPGVDPTHTPLTGGAAPG